MLYVDYGASIKDSLDGSLGRLLDLLRRYERQQDPAKYYMDWVKRAFRSSPADIRLIKSSVKLALKACAGQKRRTGEPYSIHLISAAAISGEYLDIIDAETQAATILHDTDEDHGKKYPLSIIAQRTNKTVATMVGQCNRGYFSHIEDKLAQDDAFLSSILGGPTKLQIVKSSEKIHNNVTATEEDLADLAWRARKSRTIHKWYVPMTENIGYLQEEMIASEIGIHHGIRLISM